MIVNYSGPNPDCSSDNLILCLKIDIVNYIIEEIIVQ